MDDKPELAKFIRTRIQCIEKMMKAFIIWYTTNIEEVSEERQNIATP